MRIRTTDRTSESIQLEPNISLLTEFHKLFGEAIRLDKVDRKRADSVRQFIVKKKIEAAVLYRARDLAERLELAVCRRAGERVGF